MQRSDPLVSIIIPSYNSAEFITDAIQSCVDQTWSNIEIIVVNDGSTDNLDEVLNPFMDKIIYIKQENKGLSGARNTGFTASKGEYICFLDADDTLLPDKFEKQMNIFKKEPDLGVVISGYIDIDNDGVTEIQTVKKFWYRDALGRLLNHEVFPVHAALIKRSVLPTENPFPEMPRGEYQEDWQLWLDLALSGVQFASVPEATCRYWRRAGSGSSFPLKHLDGARRVVSWLRQHPKAGQYHERIERLAAIVEMERVARAWQVHRADLASTDLASTDLAAAQTNLSQYFKSPNLWIRLFKTSLQIGELNSISVCQLPDLFKTHIIEGLLPACQEALNPTTYRGLIASAWLAESDLAYAAENAKNRRVALTQAWHESPGVCLSIQGLPSSLRGLVGPSLTRKIRKIITTKRTAS